ncbi:DgyrCDS12912 [Dimorphilus gyrociliatus]|uniref:DgyrCDS12912 n=1 Tax=Dimorphilus gyrociliatus TaxID=2664684 RepID=A0A7I8W957_9ANNE|nr:DgyrCDS12912 [Dimorphilus gyrociliatus]
MELRKTETPTLKSQAYSSEEQIALLDVLNFPEILETKEMDVRMNYGPSGQFNDNDLSDLNIDELIKNPTLELPLSPVESEFVEEEMKPENSQNLEDFEKNFDFDHFLANFKEEVGVLDDQQLSDSEPCLKRAHLDFDSEAIEANYYVEGDTKYRERRRKNNIASKRSRQIRKAKNVAQEEEVVILERQNEDLRRKVTDLEAQNKEFREKLMVLLCKKK